MFSIFKNNKPEEKKTTATQVSNVKPRDLTVSKPNTTQGIIGGQQTRATSVRPLAWVPAKTYEEDLSFILNRKNQIQNAPSLISLSVLLIDDSITVRKYIGDILKKNDFEVNTKNNGDEALNYLLELNKTIPNLIISDIEMPIMDGITFIKQIRKEHKYRNTPILVISAHAEKHLELMELGLIQGFMHKPFDNNEFLNQIQYLLDN